MEQTTDRVAVGGSARMAVWACWAAVAVGGVLAAWGVSFVREAMASHSWPSTEGRIVASRVTFDISHSDPGPEKDRWYHVEVTYRYAVGGQDHTSTRYSLGDGSRASDEFAERADAEAVRAEFLPGRTVTVYYDPASPDSAVLRPGVNLGTVAPILLGLGLAALGLFAALAIRRHEHRLAAAAG